MVIFGGADLRLAPILAALAVLFAISEIIGTKRRRRVAQLITLLGCLASVLVIDVFKSSSVSAPVLTAIAPVAQKEEANLLAVFEEAIPIQFVQRAQGEWLARVFVTIRNPTKFVATNVRFQFQHRPLSWTDVVLDRKQTFTLMPNSQQKFTFSADTVADPRGTLARGEKLYFALRADWDNPNGTVGCKLFFIEYFGTRGLNNRDADLVPYIRNSVPKDIEQGMKIPLCEKV